MKAPLVFLSYPDERRAETRAVVNYLDSHGVATWFAERDIKPGDDYDQAIVDAVDASTYMVVIFCSEADSSPGVRRELHLADQHLPVIPLKLDSTVPHNLGYLLAGKNWIDYSDGDSSVLDVLISRLQQPPSQSEPSSATSYEDGTTDSNQPLTPEKLYDQVADAMDDITFEPDTHAAFRVLSMATMHYGEMQARQPTPEDVEICRLAALAAATNQDWAAQDVWRARWLPRAVATGWTESIGYYLMSRALQCFAQSNGKHATYDEFQPSIEAEAIVNEIEVVIAMGPSGIHLRGRSPSLTGLEREFWATRGAFRLAARNYGSARADFSRALAAEPNSEPTQVKMGLNLALTDYLSGVDKPGATSRTRDLGARASCLRGFADIGERASSNASVMEAGARNLKPYDVV